jgi:predicted acetyltransferase
MAYRVRKVRDYGELAEAFGAIGHYFGWQPEAEDAERYSAILPPERMYAAFDGASMVGGAGAYQFEMTVPGGPIPCAGIMAVGVLPTHRRRGLLRRMMTRQLADIRDERREPIAALWASQETIYGRYGYGQASHCLAMKLPHVWAGLRPGLPPTRGETRYVDHDEALRTFPRIYDRVRRSSSGFVSRSRAWWELRILDDDPDRRRGGGPLSRALLERDGRPVGYALYRIAQSQTEWKRTLRVIEAIAIDPPAVRDLWRFLLAIDWMDDVTVRLLPVDDGLRHLVARVSNMDLTVGDGLWVRPMDVGAALSARAYAGDGRLTLEVVSDPLFPDNVGTWTVEGGSARRTGRRPDVRLDVQSLGSVYLGGFSFAELARAERLEEAARGGLARADAMFRTDRAPWCPEIF